MPRPSPVPFAPIGASRHLAFLRRFSEFHFGIPCADWLRTLMNRLDPDLFSACFMAWVSDWWPAVPDLIALDGKTARRSHDRKAGRKALHLVSALRRPSAWCSGRKPVRRSRTRSWPSRRCSRSLPLCGSLKGALVTIDAIACNPDIAQAILDGEADYLLAVKDNQPTLQGEVADFFATARPR